jgi:hypothetical protein
MRTEEEPRGHGADKRPSGMSDTVKGACIGALGAVAAAVIAALVGHSAGVVYIGSAPSAGPTSGPAITSISGSTETSKPSVTQTPTITGSVLREGKFTLTQGYCVDLDTAVPNWSVSSDCGTAGAINGNGDIRVDSLDILAPAGADFAVLDQSQPDSFATCDSVTDFSSELGQKSIIPGLRLCMRTTSGNFALMKVFSVNNSGGILESVTFNVVVWKAGNNS